MGFTRTMTVILRYGLTDDVKPELNIEAGLDRAYISQLVKLNFIDEKTGVVLFSYVPKLDDEKVFIGLFALIHEYDNQRKELVNFMNANELK